MRKMKIQRKSSYFKLNKWLHSFNAIDCINCISYYYRYINYFEKHVAYLISWPEQDTNGLWMKQDPYLYQPNPIFLW